MPKGLSKQKLNAIKLILRKYIDEDECESLVSEIDGIYQDRSGGFQKYKQSFPDQVPLKKGSQEFKELKGLVKASITMSKQISELSELSVGKLNSELNSINISQEVTAIKGAVDDSLLYPSDSNLSVVVVQGLLSAFSAATSTAMTNAQLSDKHLRANATLECWIIREVEYCLSSSTVSGSFSFEGGSGTTFERIIAEILGCDAQDKIRNCHRKRRQGKN